MYNVTLRFLTLRYVKVENKHNVTCRNVKNRTEFYLLRSSRKSRKRAVSSLLYVIIFTYHFSVT